MVHVDEEMSYESRLSHFKGMNKTMGRHHGRSSTLRKTQLIEGDDGDSREDTSDAEMMKEKFAKLLLGEDMSGGGKGVPSALALSNAITNLGASVFGELKRLEPMSSNQKWKWKKEIDWLLSVTDHIVEFAPSQQNTNGVNMEIMTTKQRSDLQINIPALRKLDAMLLECLDTFRDQKEFCYVGNDETSDKKRKDSKWWLPTCRVPAKGLSETTRKWLKFQKDSVSQLHIAAMAINAQVLAEMAIPESYIDSLPKNGKSSLGDSIYKCITDEHFEPENLLSTTDLSTEHKILDLKNRIEASIVIWKRKLNSKESGALKSSWSSGISLEKREIFEDRAQTILILLKQRYPGISQSALDGTKIQNNLDVGHAVLESYSRLLESLSFTAMSRIDDVLYADHIARNPSDASFRRNPLSSSSSMEIQSQEDKSSSKMFHSMTLVDFMGWSGEEDDDDEEEDMKFRNYKKAGSYLETLGGVKSPTSRH